MNMRPARPDYVSRDNIALEDNWGSVYKLDRIDSVSVRVQTNAAQIRFAANDGTPALDWRDPVDLQAGGWSEIGDGVLRGFSYFQLRRQTAGSASVVDLRAFCTGA